MFGFDSLEFLVVAIVALVVIGPKELPNVMRTVGQWVGRARGMARHFRSGVDTMIREAELKEMEKKWREENDRIMREHPMLPGMNDAPDFDHPSMLPLPRTQEEGSAPDTARPTGTADDPVQRPEDR